MTIAEALSARLTELMEERNITAYRLSMLTGVNQTTIGDIRHKRNTAVNVRILFELCQGLESKWLISLTARFFLPKT